MIFVDTREKKNRHILDFFDICGINYKPRTLKYADYVMENNPKLRIERKANMLEFSANCGIGHQRFKRELEKAKQDETKIVILIEENISYNGMMSWKSKRTQMTGYNVWKICNKWKSHFDIEFVFCSPSSSGKMIYDILRRIDERN